MRIKRNYILNTWEMAESERDVRDSLENRHGFKPGDNGRLLIVDDEESIRTLFRKSVSKRFEHLEITEACEGRSAVEAFRLNHHGIIIMDLLMPGIDGQKAFLEIKEHCDREKWAMPAVIFCTGYNPSQMIREVVAENPLHCMLHKPVAPSILLDAVMARL